MELISRSGRFNDSRLQDYSSASLSQSRHTRKFVLGLYQFVGLGTSHVYRHGPGNVLIQPFSWPLSSSDIVVLPGSKTLFILFNNCSFPFNGCTLFLQLSSQFLNDHILAGSCFEVSCMIQGGHYGTWWWLNWDSQFTPPSPSVAGTVSLSADPWSCDGFNN